MVQYKWNSKIFLYQKGIRLLIIRDVQRRYKQNKKKTNESRSKKMYADWKINKYGQILMNIPS